MENPSKNELTGNPSSTNQGGNPQPILRIPEKRKRTDSHTFQETNKPHKVAKRDASHHPTQPFVPQQHPTQYAPQYSTNRNIIYPHSTAPSIPPNTNYVAHPPTSNPPGPQMIQPLRRPPQPNPAFNLQLPRFVSMDHMRRQPVAPRVPVPMNVSLPKQFQQQQEVPKQVLRSVPPNTAKTTTTTPKEIIKPPPKPAEQSKPATLTPYEQLQLRMKFPPLVPMKREPPPQKKKRRRESDEEYTFVEEEENPDDYTIQVENDGYYHAGAKKTYRNRDQMRKEHEEADFVMDEEESSESIGESAAPLEEGEVEDIKKGYSDMLEMEALRKENEMEEEPSVVGPTGTQPQNAQIQNPAPPPGGVAGGVSTTGGESGQDSSKNYNLRTRREYPKREEGEQGSILRVPSRSKSRRGNQPLDRYAQIDEKRKQRNKKLRKRHRKMRKNQIPNSPRPKIGDTTSSDDEEQDRRNVDRFLRTGGRNPNSYTRIAPLNQGIESRRAGFKPTRADVDPVAIDKSITWDAIGGLKEHISKLKEMVILPLLYPDVYTSLGIKPPRGVLFVGPPGTGKTLTARALCNMCRVSEGKEIAFFMRKGADILSKWVGEAEKQLRMLFDRARQLQPSIIFFDEIDGLAPVRSSKQDYIHTSIVSTLLALLDGLDDRGQVVVIGATNRADAVDPALRRPGRFDRELFFPLPDEKERKEILDIHTKSWKKPVPEEIKVSLAHRAVGFCGADLKSLCTETGLKALRRKYPQIYDTTDRLRIDVSDISVSREDWEAAFKEMTPSYYKTREFYPQPLNLPLKAIFQDVFPALLNRVQETYPLRRESHGGKSSFQVYSQNDEDEDSQVFWKEMGVRRESSVGGFGDSTELGKLMIFRPSILIFGRKGNGQVSLLKALLHHPKLEYFQVFHLTLESLFSSDAGKGGFTPEERLISLFKEVRSNAPCILAIPSLLKLMANVSPATRNLFVQGIRNFPAHIPVLIVASVDVPDSSDFSVDDEEGELEEEEEEEEEVFLEKERKKVQEMFTAVMSKDVIGLFRNHFQILSPNVTARQRYFDLSIRMINSPIILSNLPSKDEDEDDDEEQEKKKTLETDNTFQIDEERRKKLMKRLLKEEKSYLDQLQDCLYRICNTILSDRHFKLFARPAVPKPVGFKRGGRGRPRGRPRKEILGFIVEDEEDEYEEDVLENIDPDAEYRPRKKVKPPLPIPILPPPLIQQEIQRVLPPPGGPPRPKKLIYVLDILEKVNSGEYENHKQFLKAFEMFRDHAGLYEVEPEPGYGRRGGYPNTTNTEKKRRLVEAGKNLFKRVEISLGTIDKALLKECKRISRRRKKRKEEMERKKREKEEEERKKLAEAEKKRQEEEMLFPPQRRVTRGLLKKVGVTPPGMKKKKKRLKIKLPKSVRIVLPKGMLQDWKVRVLKKTKGWGASKLEELYTLWLREITKFKWQPKREKLLNNLEFILDNLA